MSQLEEDFLSQIRFVGLPEPEREHVFALPRRWRFDFAWPEIKLAVEVEGGIWNKGRHTRGSGFAGDVEKYNTATKLGWAVLRVIINTVESGEGISLVSEVHHERTKCHNDALRIEGGEDVDPS